MNKASLVGRLVADAKTIRGGSVFTVAINNNLKTQFIPVVSFNEKLTAYLLKGRLISVEGHLEVSKKNEKTRVVIVADAIGLLDKKPAAISNDVALAGEMADVPAFASRA